MKQYFVTGISTEVGKTVVSAILVEALKADYWKPIQAGDLSASDTMKVRQWISNQTTHFHKETYQLKHPISPHAAAGRESIKIEMDHFKIPSGNNLIVEGAGGLMVPLNEKQCLIDLIKHLKIPTILVSKNYLGSINHTLLSTQALERKNLPLAGIIFNGDSNPDSENYILNYAGVPCLGRLKEEKIIDQAMILKYAQQWNVNSW